MGCKSVYIQEVVPWVEEWVVDMKVISSVVWLLESIIDTHWLST